MPLLVNVLDTTTIIVLVCCKCTIYIDNASGASAKKRKRCITMMRASVASEPKNFDVQNPVMFFVGPPSRVVLFFVGPPSKAVYFFPGPPYFSPPPPDNK